jgi:hypothetical protein
MPAVLRAVLSLGGINDDRRHHHIFSTWRALAEHRQDGRARS